VFFFALSLLSPLCSVSVSSCYPSPRLLLSRAPVAPVAPVLPVAPVAPWQPRSEGEGKSWR
jgi:hypothetical protein